MARFLPEAAPTALLLGKFFGAFDLSKYIYPWLSHLPGPAWENRSLLIIYFHAFSDPLQSNQQYNCLRSFAALLRAFE